MPDEFLLNKAVRTISIKNKASVDTRVCTYECLGATISHSQFRRYRRNVFSHICWSLKELLGDLV
ncbi:hypothetical protein Scep_002519 [Stephania cephalantha]|uniref:Uncharacterized protein n=1 Tax=Stephania cephalantha TaxID=152367 RepID=A0AAP0LBC9_9MAGN